MTDNAVGKGYDNMKRAFRLEGLDCADCAAKMENAIGRIDGVKSATVNFITTRLVIEADDDRMDDVIANAERIVKKYEPDTVMKRA